MAKVTVVAAASRGVNVGDVYRRPNSDHYVVISLGGEKRLINLTSWNRWSNDSLFGGADFDFTYVGKVDEVVVK